MIKFRSFDKLIIVLVVFFYYCDFILYPGIAYNLNVINAKKITLDLFLPLFLLLVVIRHIKLSSLFKKPIIRWLLVFFIASVYAVFLNVNETSAYDIFRTVVFSILIIFLITGFLDNDLRLQFAQKCVIAGVLFSVVMNIADFLHLLSLSTVLGRAAGFYLNPNSAGIALSFGLVLLKDKIASRWRTWFIFFVGLGIVLTFSRAAMIFYAFFLMYYLFIQKGISRSIKFLTALIILLAAIYFNQKISSLYELGKGTNTNITERLDFISHPFQNESDVTDDIRVGVAKYAFIKFIENPIIGYGLGYNHTLVYQGQDIESHNQYLDFLLDYGLIGGIIFLYYFTRLRKKKNEKYKVLCQNYILTLLFFSFFSHNLFDEYSMLFIHAFAWASLTRKETVTPETI